MPHKRNPQLSDDCITIGAQLRALVPLALEGMLHDHENDGAHSAMLDDALQRACALTGDLLVRLEVILSGLVVDPARMRANLDLTGGMISSEAVMLGLGRSIGRKSRTRSFTTPPGSRTPRSPKPSNAIRGSPPTSTPQL